LPGQAATFANVTSYSRGINGVMVDVLGLPTAGSLSRDDFDFGTGPAPMSVNVRRGAGTGGSDRVTLLWADYGVNSPAASAVANGWLSVTVKPTAATGLAAPDTFSFGNLIGETGDPRSAGWAVNVIDLARTRAAFPSVAPITTAFDFNRDGAVNAADLTLARANHGRSIAPPTTPPAPSWTSALPPRVPRRAAYLFG
jgi:hypothetical protein